ncbi:hypothetical protein PHET_04246 [Paragonimus heterotremus]|uniref:Uncharacterized protein n=1 Tax=Paragonimus heterotremus TaxID=100268 RepID=A0A8J4SQJ2_9TREM|nr:hypothetical protein PHET_04246 [Paragonimus heterotremus]
MDEDVSGSTQAELARIAKSCGIEKQEITLYDIGVTLAEKLKSEPIRKNVSSVYDNNHIQGRAEEKGLRNILRFKGERAILNLLVQPEEVLKPHCFSLLTRIAQSLRGKVVIMECLATPETLLRHLHRSPDRALMVLKLLTSLLGMPTARIFFNQPSLTNYLSKPVDDPTLNGYVQLVSWLISLPINRLVDHLADTAASRGDESEPELEEDEQEQKTDEFVEEQQAPDEENSYESLTE